MKTALVLSGGGARAAYQVGVLKAIGELLPDTGQTPFQIISGTSSGAINAAKVASQSDDFHGAVEELERLWSTLESAKVHRVGFAELIESVFKLVGSFFHSGIASGRPLSLFDNEPLRRLLKNQINLGRLNEIIQSGKLHAICISALGYSSGQNISFIQGHESIKGWSSARRAGIATQLSHEHLLASSALPAIFPAVKIHREYFGDGALRQTAPMSSALNLGADKLLVIGVSGNNKKGYVRESVKHSPTIAQVLGHLLNSAFIDSLEDDVETVDRYNSFIEYMAPEGLDKLAIKKVDVLVIQPSIEMDQLAGNYIQHLPRSMRLLLKIIGANRQGGSSLASYILFEHQYTKALMHHGYCDAMDQAEKIRKFIGTCTLT